MSMAVEQQPPQEQQQRESFRVAIYLHQEREHWSAMIPEFTIAGRGFSAAAAAENAMQLLCDYLAVCTREGMTVEEARRPAPLASRLRLRAEFLLARLRSGDARAKVEERSVGPLGLAGC